MLGWYHQLNGHEFEQNPRDGEVRGNLACCSPWGLKELDITECLNSSNKCYLSVCIFLCLIAEYLLSISEIQQFKHVALLSSRLTCLDFESQIPNFIKFWRVLCLCMRAQLLQSCPTLCDPMDCSTPGSSVHGILQAKILKFPFPSPGDLPYLGI